MKPFALLVLAMIIFVPLACNSFQRKTPVSSFGKYAGFSERVYANVAKTSAYLEISDGTRLAYDLFLPSNKGQPARTGMPVLFCYTTYLRAFNLFPDGKLIDEETVPLNWIAKSYMRIRAMLKKNGNIVDLLFREPWLKQMLGQGYAVIVVEARGTGASSGIIKPVFRLTAKDIHEVLDWISAQPWCGGRIGMFGKSMVAMNQYAAASSGHPSLKAIFPVSAGFDMYDAVIYPGGIYNKAFGDLLSSSTATLEKMTVPVDSDPDGKELATILAYRQKHFTLDRSAAEGFLKAPFRDSDSRHPDGGKLWADMGPYTLLEKVNAAKIPVYNATGWRDIFCRDAILWHANLTVPRKLYISSLSHSELGKKKKEFDHGIEARRWFDYWLKGVPNNIMEETSIHYAVAGASGKATWASGGQWPLPQSRRTDYFLDANGILSTAKAGAVTWSERKKVDYTTTTGDRSRWRSILADCVYPDMRANDSKSLTYTTPLLEKDMYIVGHPVIRLTLQTDAPDLDVFVYLEEIDSKGNSRYLTEGCLRVSHRKPGDAPYNNLGLPYQRSYRQDLARLETETPFCMTLDLLPLAVKISSGNRLRTAIAFTDDHNFTTPLIEPSPTVRIQYAAATASRIVLPVLE